MRDRCNAIAVDENKIIEPIRLASAGRKKPARLVARARVSCISPTHPGCTAHLIIHYVDCHRCAFIEETLRFHSASLAARYRRPIFARRRESRRREECEIFRFFASLHANFTSNSR